MTKHRSPLRLCTVVSPETTVVLPYVHCPVRGDSIDANACAGCPNLSSLECEPSRGGTVVCRVDAPLPVAPDGRADLAEAAVRTPVRDVIPALTFTVTRDLPIDEVSRLMGEHGLRAVAVVDRDGRLEGIVSRSDLTTVTNIGSARSFMNAPAEALLDDAPLSHAIALMALQNISEVPVLAPGGKVLGMLHALDVLRWVAARMGYAFQSTGLAEGAR